MPRPVARFVSLCSLVLAVLALMPASGAAVNAPMPRIVQPPDRFFQEGDVLDVVVGYDGANVEAGRRHPTLAIQLIVDGSLIEDRTVPMRAGVSTFRIPIRHDDPIGLIQVCIRKNGSGDRACRQVRAAGAKEFDAMRRSLEEMNEISDAVLRYAFMRLGYRGVPQSLEQMVPDFLDHVPSVSPLSTTYEYTASDYHFVLRLALPGSGEIRVEDATFTKLPAGAITDREAARVTRQQLWVIAQSVESYRVDNNVFPERINDVAPIYQRFLPAVDPYGHPFVYSLAPDAYLLTGLGRDGLPGGEGFDADTKVTTGMQLVATTPYRGRYEYIRRTFIDMSQIAASLSYFQEENGRWPASLSELVGGPWFSWPRPFADACGNPYDYRLYDIGFGVREYQLRAYGCSGVPETEPDADLLYFAATNDGYTSAPGARFAYRWPGLFD